MARGPEISRAEVAVALMALSKREFFERLLANPAGALAEVRTELGLTPDEESEVKALIDEGKKGMTEEAALRLWDAWRSSGKWGSAAFWPKFIPFWPTT